MPFKSKAQRGFMYSQHPKLAKEFEAATPEGAKLPEHVKKFNEGGEVLPEDKENMHDKYKKLQDNGFGNLGDQSKGLQALANRLAAERNKVQTSTEPVKMAFGGDVKNALSRLVSPLQSVGQGTQTAVNHTAGDFMPGAPDQSIQNMPPIMPTTPQNVAPPLSQTMQNINQTPDTNYDFYRDISADDRAKLYQQLTDKQNAGGMLAARGVAGIGDAISNSFGKGGAKAAEEIVAETEANKQGKLGSFDTQRTQKMQDMAGNQEMMMNNPNSPIAHSMRETLKGSGLNVPSGMSPSLMLKVAGPLGELALKQATLGVQQQVANQNQVNQVSGRRMEAAKGVQGRPWYQKGIEMVPGMKSDATQLMQGEMGTSSTENQMAPGPHGATLTQNGHTYIWNGTNYE